MVSTYLAQDYKRVGATCRQRARRAGVANPGRDNQQDRADVDLMGVSTEHKEARKLKSSLSYARPEIARR